MPIPEKLAAYGIAADIIKSHDLDVKNEWVHRVPLYVIAMHKLVRLGVFDRRSQGSGRLVQLDADKHGVIFNKWSPLKDAERFTIIYEDPFIIERRAHGGL